MIKAAKCPNCGAPLDETSVVALAPVCHSCDTVLTNTGGTLGLTGVFGVSDPTITRRRVEADLAVFHEYQVKYRGMKEACKQQLGWGVERYAKLPQPPELLKLKDVPSFWKGLGAGLGLSAIWFVGAIFVTLIIDLLYWISTLFSKSLTGKQEDYIFFTLFFGGCVVIVLGFLFPHYRARIANGKRPRENARRQKAHEEAVAAALKAAEPLKEAEDHRLRCQIRDVEGNAETVDKKEADVRQLLATL